MAEQPNPPSSIPGGNGGGGVNPSQSAVMLWIAKVSAAFGIPAALIYARADIESNFTQFSPNGGVLTSSAGAVGIMQTIPRYVPDAWNLDVIHSWHDNVIAGVRELAGYYTQFGNWHDAFAAYAAGPANLPAGQAAAAHEFDVAKTLYDWNGAAGHPDPNAHFDPSAPGPTGGGGSGGTPKNTSYLHPDQWMGRFANGHVNPDAMIDLGIKDRLGHEAYMRPDAAAAFQAMVAAAKADGVDIIAGFGNAYRDYATQAALWEQSHHGTLFQCAPPGHSNHGYGIAMDIPTGTAAWTWVTAHGKQFGFTGDTTPSDPPHFDFAPNGTVGGVSKWDWAVTYTKGQGWSVETTTPKMGTPAGGGSSKPTTSGPSGGGTTSAELEAILRGFGVNPHAFHDIIDQAIRGQWSPAQFTSALYASKEFHAMFPGIFRADGSLMMAPSQWNQMADIYRQQVRGTTINLDRDRIGALIHGDVSADEWAERVRILVTAQNSEHFRNSFNGQLKIMGREPVNKGGWYDQIAGRAPSTLYDLYEAAYLQSGGLPVAAKGAARVARGIDDRGQVADTASLADLVRKVQAARAFIGPELTANGIGNADLALLEAGKDPRGLATTLQQILSNRQALAGAIPRAQTFGQSRTVALFPTPTETL